MKILILVLIALAMASCARKTYIDQDSGRNLLYIHYPFGSFGKLSGTHDRYLRIIENSSGSIQSDIILIEKIYHPPNISNLDNQGVNTSFDGNVIILNGIVTVDGLTKYGDDLSGTFRIPISVRGGHPTR